MYEKPATAEADLGLKPEDFPPIVIDVWPDVWPSVVFFESLSTQWNVITGGVIGLRYEAVDAARRARSISDEDWPQIFDDVQVMEREALRVMNDEIKRSLESGR